jgi:CubicO group peptidase (beta-lactamase class C family)
MDAGQLDLALEDLKTRALELNSLLVIRNGAIVSETYYPSTDQTTRHELYSVTMGFTSTLVESSNWAAFVLNTPIRSHPGSEFNVCSGCSHVLSAVVQKMAGADNPAFTNQNLFCPLGIQNYRLDTDSTGVPVGGWGLQLTPRDMARRFTWIPG